MGMEGFNLIKGNFERFAFDHQIYINFSQLFNCFGDHQQDEPSFWFLAEVFVIALEMCFDQVN